MKASSTRGSASSSGRPDTATVADLAMQLQDVAEQQARLHATVVRIARLLPLVTVRREPISTETSDYLTVGDAAKLLKVDRSTVYAWMEHRRLPFQHVGTRRRIRRDALETWLNEQDLAWRP